MTSVSAQAEPHTNGTLEAPRDLPDRRSGGARGRDDARRLHLGRRRAQAHRGGAGRRRARPHAGCPWRDRDPHRAAGVCDQAPPGPAAAVDPRRRGPRRVAQDRLQGAWHLGQRAARDDDEGEKQEIGGGTWVGTIVFALVFAIGLFFLLPVGLTNLFKDSIPNSFTFVVVEKAIRISIFLAYLWLISRMRTSARVRVPRRRAQDDLLLRGRAGPDAGERPALLAPAPALRHQLPADRDGRGDLRVRPARAPAWHWLFVSRVVGIRWSRDRLRGDQVVRPQPHQALGAPDVARPAAAAPDHPEPDLAQLAVAIAALEAVLAVENPAAATERRNAWAWKWWPELAPRWLYTGVIERLVEQIETAFASFSAQMSDPGVIGDQRYADVGRAIARSSRAHELAVGSTAWPVASTLPAPGAARRGRRGPGAARRPVSARRRDRRA